MGEGFPKSLAVTIMYDEHLRLITGKAAEECLLSEGAPFFFLLSSVLDCYPEIREKYPPGILGFTVNGEPPEMDTVLREGDIVRFLVVLPRYH